MAPIDGCIQFELGFNGFMEDDVSFVFTEIVSEIVPSSFSFRLICTHIDAAYMVSSKFANV